jgi:myosin-7
VPLKKDQANDNRDSIAKTVYDKLFNYIVEYINNSTATKQPVANFIGVLDIFGFELFEVNSFEQLCINYTNEKLQQFFNQFIFKLEQEEYAKEGIPVESVQYKDNQPCLDLIESKTGVLAMLDEECKVPKGNDETYLAKLHEAHKKNENYVCPKTAKGVFGIKHYAGEVTYQVVNFMDKNKDAVQEEVAELLQAASNEIVKKLFKKATDDKSGQKKNVTAGTNFKTQLSTLVTTLSSTTPHYVRCVKPNMEKKAMIFDDNLVLSQLRYAGMLETIRIRKSGYPMRFSYDIFNHRFRFISGKGIFSLRFV